MSKSTLEPIEVHGGFVAEYVERPMRARKRPAATTEPNGDHEDFSPGLMEVLSKLNFIGSPSSTANTPSSLVVQEIVEPPPNPSPYIDRGLPLPESYGLNRLVAMVRDPEWVFTYWELDQTSLSTIKKERGDAFVESCAWVMRVYRVDEESAADMEIDPSAGGWYIHVGRPGRYVFEMALLSPEGEWLSLVVSAMLGAPYAGVSERVDEVWRLSPEEEAALSGVIQEVIDNAATNSSGGSRGASSLGASRLRSSFGGVVSSGSFMGGSERMAFLSSSGGVGGVSSGGVTLTGVTSGSVGGVSSGGVAGSWHFPGSSGRVPGSAIPGSGGSGGFGWTIAPTGVHEPVLIRPQIFGTGPNWNAQPNLPEKPPEGKTHQPHFKVKLPRMLYKLTIPKQTWPPLVMKAVLKKVS